MKKTGTTILLILGILIFANLVANQFFFRVDLTEDKQYTLSKATKDIMKDLESPITVKAYFTDAKNLPPNIAKTRKDFEEFLIEYARLSDNNLVYTFINPNESEEKEREAMQAGINPVMINVREKDQMKQQKAYLGAILSLEDQKEVIPVVQPGAAMEYMLSSSIKKIAVTDKPEIALLQGQGQPSLQEMQQAKQSLEILYKFSSFDLNDSTSVPSTYKTIALIRPSDTLQASELQQLDTFLENGGNLFVALNSVQGDLNKAFGSSVHTGVEDWLQQKGITISKDFLIDARCASVGVRQQQGMFSFNTNVSFPYLPIISSFSDHPITKGLEAVVLQFASPITFKAADSLKTFTPIAFSSKNSGTVKAPTSFDIQKQWTESDFPLPKQAIAGILEEKHPNGKTSKICVVSDGDFAVQGAQQQRIQGDNVNLLVNAMDWLSDDTGLIDLRSKGIQYRPIDALEDSTKLTLKYLNFLLPILLVIGYGIIRMQLNKNKRVRSMQEQYVS